MANPGPFDNLATAFTQITDWIGDMAAVITGAPIYLVGLAIWVAGAVLALGYRLIRGN